MTSQSLSEVECTVSFPGEPEIHWQILSYHCHEELSGGCNVVLDLATEDMASELSAFLGTTCELLLVRGDGHPQQHLYGVVLRVDLIGHIEHRLVARLHVTSAFELGRQRRHSRIWQNVSPLSVITEVLDELLGDYGRTYNADSLSRGSEPRTYCVQYRETDFDFVRRLLEEEGISYYFAHRADVGHEVLTLCDDNGQYDAAENPFFPMIVNNPNQAEVESIQGLEWSQQLTTTAVLRRDYDWQRPRELLTAELEGTDQRDRIRRVYTHTERRFEHDDLETRAGDLAAALALRGSIARGRSNSISLRPGTRFSTDAHSMGGARSNTSSRAFGTAVVHRGRAASQSATALCTRTTSSVSPPIK